MNENKQNLRSLTDFLAPYRGVIARLAFLELIAAGFTLFMPYLSKLMVDQSLLARNIPRFFQLALVGAGLFIVTKGLGVFLSVAQKKAFNRIQLKLERRFLRRLYSFDLRFFHTYSLGERYKSLFEAQRITNFVVTESPMIVSETVKLAVMLVICFLINAELTLASLALGCFFFLQSFLMRRRFVMIYQKIWDAGARLSRTIFESFSNIVIIKALGKETRQRNRYLRMSIANIRLGVESYRWETTAMVISSSLSKGIYALITLYGGWLMIKGRITFGTYTALVLYINMMSSSIQELSHRFQNCFQESVYLGRFLEMVRYTPAVSEAVRPVTVSIPSGALSMRSVSFGYANGTPVLAGIELSIPQGSWVAVVGPSGCGKTTLANLLLRLYDPWQGEVCLDGLDLKKISFASFRKLVSAAFQQPFLFDDTVYANIALGSENVSRAAVEEAAELCGLGEFIAGLPQGYATMLGEDAFRLSQGLKQRVALARAVLRDAYLLVLDEATSSIDSSSERRIFDALRARRAGRVTVVISHRLFSVEDADRIFFLDNGALAEEGSHAQLLEKSARYRSFFVEQLKDHESIKKGA